MSKEEIVEFLKQTKQSVTEKGHQYLQTKLPVPMDKFGEYAKPFVIVEKAIDKAIKKITT